MTRAAPGDVFLDAEVIDDLEHAEHAVRHHAGKIPIRFRGNDTHGCHVPILHDNMNRRHGAPGMAIQTRLGIDGHVGFDANPVVVERKRQRLDLVLQFADPLDCAHDILGIDLQGWTRDLPCQNHRFDICDLVRQIVK